MDNEFKQRTVRYEGPSLKFWSSGLLAIFSAIISIFSTGTDSTNTSTVFVLFIGVLVVLYSVLINGSWGILTSFFSALLFCLTLRVSSAELILNICANTMQAVILWIVLCRTKMMSIFDTGRAKFNTFNCILFFMGVLYLVWGGRYNDISVILFFVIAVWMLYVLHAFLTGDKLFVIYPLAVCLLPSFVGASINSMEQLWVFSLDSMSVLQPIAIWTFSNFVLFGLFGYLLILVTYKANQDLKSVKGKAETTEEERQSMRGWLRSKLVCTHNLKASVIIYYLATLVWNALIYGMYVLGWFAESTVFYLIPWMVGNIFFVANLFMAKRIEIDDAHKSEAFDWFENRTIVAENNTQMLIAIISILLPISAEILGADNPSLPIVFMLNITMAIISIGLVWVPKDDAGTMEIVKNIKTVCHLFTLSLLLLAIFMIIIGKAGYSYASFSRILEGIIP